MLLLDFLLPPPRPRRNANPPEPALPRGAASRRGAAGAAGAGRGAPSPGRSFSLHPRPHGVPTPRLSSPRTRRHPRTSTGDGAARGAVPRGCGEMPRPCPVTAPLQTARDHPTAVGSLWVGPSPQQRPGHGWVYAALWGSGAHGLPTATPICRQRSHLRWTSSRSILC